MFSKKYPSDGVMAANLAKALRGLLSLYQKNDRETLPQEIDAEYVLADYEDIEKNDPLGMEAKYEASFGKGSWAELESGVLERLKVNDPILYQMINRKAQ